MSRAKQIQKALEDKGIDDVLAWARERATVSLSDLNRQLDTGVAPYYLEQYMATTARKANSYEDFVRVEACRRLNESFPQGVGASDNPEFGFASSWAMWAGLHEARNRPDAERA